jgi:hypothetical protein
MSRNGHPDNPCLQAALDYATNPQRPLFVFPAKPGEKKSRLSKRFAFDGQNWGLTNSPDTIKKYWQQFPDSNVCIVTGDMNGLFVVETDGAAHGKDGDTELKKLIAANGGEWPDTRKARSPSGSEHFYFTWPDDDDIDIRNSDGKLAPGIDVRGTGGMAVAPPSYVPKYNACYEWINPEVGIKAAPGWLIKLLKEKLADRKPGEPQAPIEKLAAAMSHIPNDKLNMEWEITNYETGEIESKNGWEEWNRISMALFRATGGTDEGYAIFHEWCEKNKFKFNENYTRNTWYKRYRRSPPKTVGAGTLFTIAETYQPGWEKQWDYEHDDANKKPDAAKYSLDETHAVFRKWLGAYYDMDALNATAAAAASERLTGDPLWLLIISGPGNAKTETVQSLMGSGAHVTSTIASEGALLSATPQRSRKKKATGGLLRKIGDHGVLVIKDVTSILSADRNVRPMVLAAIREIYDGRWERNVGSDGGQTLTWIGRIVIIGAVTTAWDSAHSVVSAMGDRFVLIRIDSNLGRQQSGRMAINNTSQEIQMRKELSDAMGGLVLHATTDNIPITPDEIELLLKAADIVTLARTAVERDYQGEVTNSHAPEMPTRFAKQLTQMIRGAVAIGMTRKAAVALALRCARDSIPPLRLAILLDIANHSYASVGDVRKRINKPWRTVKREIDGLHMLGLLNCDEETYESEGEDSKTKTKWLYDLNELKDSPGYIDRATLLSMAPASPDIPF